MKQRIPQYLLEQARMTAQQVAEQVYGLKTFDTAIPQPVFDDCLAKGFNPYGVVVWCYDEAKILGAPFPLTLEAEAEFIRVFPGVNFPPAPQVELTNTMLVLKLLHDIKVELTAEPYLVYKLAKAVEHHRTEAVVYDFLQIIESINKDRMKQGG